MEALDNMQPADWERIKSINPDEADDKYWDKITIEKIEDYARNDRPFDPVDPGDIPEYYKRRAY